MNLNHAVDIPTVLPISQELLESLELLNKRLNELFLRDSEKLESLLGPRAFADVRATQPSAVGVLEQAKVTLNNCHIQVDLLQDLSVLLAQV
jgi:hypothetical protein